MRCPIIIMNLSISPFSSVTLCLLGGLTLSSLYNGKETNNDRKNISGRGRDFLVVLDGVESRLLLLAGGVGVVNFSSLPSDG